MSNARTIAGEIDLPAAHAFCDALAGSDSPLTFQTFAERAGATTRATVKHGALRDHADALTRANVSGAGVFLTINATDGHGRKAANVRSVRAVFADFDGAPLPDAFPIRPHALIESSPARWHAYWFCSLALDRFAGVQRSIAHAFDSDPAVCDLPRVMRLPGFIHQKAEPFKTRIAALEVFPAYRDREILDAFPAIAQTPEKAPCRILQGRRNADLFKRAQLWHRQGRDYAFILSKLRSTNASQCEPPLQDDELRGLAARAVAVPRNDKLLRPLAFMDAPAYLGLTHSARALLIEAERFAQLQGNGNVPLTPSMLTSRGFSANTIKAGIRALTHAGLIERTREPIYGKQGEHKVCALYRVCYL